MADPSTAAEWHAYALRHEKSANVLFAAGQKNDAVFHAGLSVEAMLKAAIMLHQRLNTWPPRSSRKELYVHNLLALSRYAGMDVFGLVDDPVAPMWQTVLLWERSQGYDPFETPDRVANDMLAAACGSEGVNRWIEHRFRLDR